MAEQSEIQIPGTKAKLPTKWLLIGGAVLVAFFLLPKGGGGDEEDGMLASELDQRLQEQWDAILSALEQSKQQGETGLPEVPPEAPIEPAPVSQPSSRGSYTPWRGGMPGTIAGINLPGEGSMGIPATVSMKPPSTTTFQERKERLKEHEARGATRRTPTPITPRPRLPESRKRTLVRRERESPALKQSTATTTRPPVVKPPTIKEIKTSKTRRR